MPLICLRNSNRRRRNERPQNTGLQRTATPSLRPNPVHVPTEAREEHMPRIRDEILDSVFYLYPTADAAKSGESAGGTGFLVAIRSVTQPEFFVHIYAVTNSHVIREGKSPFIRLNTVEGASAIWHLKGMEWVHHPDADDVAICEIP